MAKTAKPKKEEVKPAKPEAATEPKKEEKLYEMFSVDKDASGHQVKAGEVVVKTFKTEKAAVLLKDWLNCGYTGFRREQDAKKK